MRNLLYYQRLYYQTLSFYKESKSISNLIASKSSILICNYLIHLPHSQKLLLSATRTLATIIFYSLNKLVCINLMNFSYHLSARNLNNAKYTSRLPALFRLSEKRINFRRLIPLFILQIFLLSKKKNCIDLNHVIIYRVYF